MSILSKSIIQIKVERSGRVAFGISEDEFPGTTTYFSIDGARFKGSAGYWVPADAHALRALKEGKPIQAVWQKWPYRGEINDEDVLAGFSVAYEECLAHLRAG